MFGGGGDFLIVKSNICSSQNGKPFSGGWPASGNLFFNVVMLTPTLKLIFFFFYGSLWWEVTQILYLALAGSGSEWRRHTFFLYPTAFSLNSCLRHSCTLLQFLYIKISYAMGTIVISLTLHLLVLYMVKEVLFCLFYRKENWRLKKYK